MAIFTNAFTTLTECKIRSCLNEGGACCLCQHLLEFQSGKNKGRRELPQPVSSSADEGCEEEEEDASASAAQAATKGSRKREGKRTFPLTICRQTREGKEEERKKGKEGEGEGDSSEEESFVGKEEKERQRRRYKGGRGRETPVIIISTSLSSSPYFSFLLLSILRRTSAGTVGGGGGTTPTFLICRHGPSFPPDLGRRRRRDEKSFPFSPSSDPSISFEWPSFLPSSIPSRATASSSSSALVIQNVLGKRKGEEFQLMGREAEWRERERERGRKT